jgi:hypothetical protein
MKIVTVKGKMLFFVEVWGKKYQLITEDENGNSIMCYWKQIFD